MSTSVPWVLYQCLKVDSRCSWILSFSGSDFPCWSVCAHQKEGCVLCAVEANVLKFIVFWRKRVIKDWKWKSRVKYFWHVCHRFVKSVSYFCLWNMGCSDLAAQYQVIVRQCPHTRLWLSKKKCCDFKGWLVYKLAQRNKKCEFKKLAFFMCFSTMHNSGWSGQKESHEIKGNTHFYLWERHRDVP